MTKARKREWWDVTRLEFRHSYRSPLVEYITIFFLYVSFSAANSITSYMNSIDTRPGPMWDGTNQIEYFLSYMNSITTIVFSTILEQLWMTILFIMPLIVAFTSARSFEDGSLRTLLSYPVKRSHLLIMRILVPVFIIGGISTFSALLALLLMVPAPLNIGVIMGFIGVFCMALFLSCASISLLAVLTKRMVTTAIGGVAVWFGLLTLSYMPWSPKIISWIANPTNMLSQYLSGGEGAPMMGDVLVTIGIMFTLVILFLCASVALFRKTEV